MTRVLCVGAAVADFVFYLPEIPDRPEKYGTTQAAVVGGGNAANAAVAISRLGGQAVLAAQLGDDPIGDLVLTDLAAEQVDVSNVTRTQGGQSSYSSIVVDAAGERQIVNFSGRGLSMNTDWFQDVSGLCAVLADSRRAAEAVDALELAKVAGIPGIIDGEAPIDPSVLHPASHIALSMQGLQNLYSDTPPKDALRLIYEVYGGWVCVTDGENGVYYFDGQNQGHIPAFATEVVDTLGAGDVWHGAFALQLAKGAREVEAVEYANAAAALKCTRLGGRTGCPSHSEIEIFLPGAKTK